MTTTETNRLVDDYLRRLEEAAAHMQRSRRVELVAEIREHIEAALREEDAASEAAVRNVLERLGPPEEIVEADAPPAEPTRRAGALEIAALVALVLPLIGWLIGIVLVLVSRAWSSRDKLIGIGLALIPALVPVIAIVASSHSGTASLEVSEQPATQPAPVGVEESGGGDAGLGAVEVLVLVFGFFCAGLPSALFLGWRLRRT
jgi:hypothetical protein